MVKRIAKPQWLMCPRCGHKIGEYNEELEQQRAEENFRSWCGNCFTAVIPLYI